MSNAEVYKAIDHLTRPTLDPSGFDVMARIQARADQAITYGRPLCAKARCMNFADAEVFIILPLPETAPVPLCVGHAKLFSAVMIVTGMGVWTGASTPLRLGFNTIRGGAYDDGRIDL